MIGSKAGIVFLVSSLVIAACTHAFDLQFETIPLEPRSRVDAIAYLGNGVVLAGTRNSPHPGYIHKSTDYGRTWCEVGDITGDDFITCLASGTDGEAYLLTGRDIHVWRTTDYGDTWTDLGKVADAENSHFANAYGMLVTPQGTVLVADANETGGGIHRSIDSGSTWQHIGPISTHAIYRLNAVGDGIIANGWAGRVYKSTDDGQTWFELSKIDDCALYAIEYIGNSTVLMGTEKGDIYRSEDNGKSWLHTSQPGAAADDFAHLGGTRVLYTTYSDDRHLYLSEDGGITWRDLGPTPTPEPNDWLDHVISINDPNHKAVVGGTNQGYILYASLPDD